MYTNMIVCALTNKELSLTRNEHQPENIQNMNLISCINNKILISSNNKTITP